MPSFEQDHLLLLELANILEPQSSYHLDHTYSAIDQITNVNNWDESIDGPTLTEIIDCTPWN